MIVIRRRGRTRRQAGRNTFAYGKTRQVNTRLDRSQLEAQHSSDIVERYLRDFRKTERQSHLRRQFGHR